MVSCVPFFVFHVDVVGEQGLGPVGGHSPSPFLYFHEFPSGAQESPQAAAPRVFLAITPFTCHLLQAIRAP